MGAWATFRQILSICWQHRFLAAKYMAIPLVIDLALTFVFGPETTDDPAAIALNFGLALVSLLVFAPFCVAWYRMVLFGQQALDLRPVFTLGKLEWRFFGWQILLSILPIFVALIIVLLGGGVLIAISAINATAAAILGTVGVVAGLLLFLWIVSRWSITLAMVAAGEDASLDAAWTQSKPYGWMMVWVQLLLFLAVGIGFMILASPFFANMIELAKTQAEPTGAAGVYLNVLSTLFGAVVLWLLSTMFALVYGRIQQVGASQQLLTPEPGVPTTAP